MNRLLEIQNLIDKSDENYYTKGTSLLEDSKYDKLKDELKQLNPNDPRLVRIGSTIKDSILQKKPHSVPMGSLTKASNRQEYDDWIKNNLIKAGISNSEKLHASLKFDGGSFSLEYKDGRLIEAISRGDGEIGEDITANAINFKGVPNFVKIGGNLFSGYVRGEVVLLLNDWLKVDPNQESNPRNMAVGISRRKNGEESEHLTFYAFRAFSKDGNPIGEDEEDMCYLLNNAKFFISDYILGDFDEVYDWFLKISKQRKDLPFWIDGVVLKLNNIKKQISLGESSNRPKAQVALKFSSEGGIAIIEDVIHQIGSSGCICPVAQFSDVRIGGSTINNASLYNYDYVEEIGLCIGDEVEIQKMGDIIPRVVEVLEKGVNRKKIEIPTNCPVCESKLSRKENITGSESSALFCINKTCPAIVKGKIDKYLSSLDVLGIGENLIESLVNDLKIKDAADLYLLNDRFDDLSDLKLSGKTRLGEKRAQKFLNALDLKKNLTLSDFLGSLGIFGLGKRRVILIQQALKGKMDYLENWLDDTLVKNSQYSTVPNTAERINKEIIENKEYINKFIKNGVKIMKNESKEVNSNVNALKICITGELSRGRKEYQQMIESKGHIFCSSVTKDLNYLVAADPYSGSSKLVKAEKNGTKIIGEEDLLELVS